MLVLRFLCTTESPAATNIKAKDGFDVSPRSPATWWSAFERRVVVRVGRLGARTGLARTRCSENQH
eukprot:8951681-Heterocapsa_arctica.AAC.1